MNFLKKIFTKRFNFCENEDNKPQTFFYGMMEVVCCFIYYVSWLFCVLFSIASVIVAIILYKFYVLTFGIIALIVWLKFFRKKK
jgi:hypothetical protein